MAILRAMLAPVAASPSAKAAEAEEVADGRAGS
jgi:hypothetical protein